MCLGSLLAVVGLDSWSRYFVKKKEEKLKKEYLELLSELEALQEKLTKDRAK